MSYLPVFLYTMVNGVEDKYIQSLITSFNSVIPFYWLLVSVVSLIENKLGTQRKRNKNNTEKKRGSKNHNE